MSRHETGPAPVSPVLVAPRVVPFFDLAAMHAEVQPELDAVWRRTCSTGGFVGGPLPAELETRWAEICQVRHGVGVANGTDALELSIRALGIGPGDEVIIPTTTFIATAAAVAGTGATPVFTDVDPATLLVTGDHIRAALSPRTAAVIPVHLYGQMCDMEDVMAVAEAAGIAVVEDAAQAHLAEWNGRPAGSFGVTACFSFYPGKNLGAFGDAGMVVTDDAQLASRIRSLANHGRSTDHHTHAQVGVNSRLDALQAGVLLAKIPHLPRWTDRRRAVAATYRAALDGTQIEQVVIAHPERAVHHLFVVRVPQRDRVRHALAEAGIGTGVHYPLPCHRQEAFIDRAPATLPVAERAADEVLSLPMHPHMETVDVDAVVAALLDVVEGRRAA